MKSTLATIRDGKAPQLGADEVRIQPATAQDAEFVLGAFEMALRSYYGGNHEAHARRVLATHFAGGEDTRGLLSRRQVLFVLWEGKRRRGLLNLVFKHQGTCKISPLILYPFSADSRGLGKQLLEVAQREALAAGAHNLYCTVARRNESAFSFFLESGFSVCGQSLGQYKDREVEMLLQKAIHPSGLAKTEDIISVTELTDRLGDASVIAMLHEKSKLMIQNIDPSWVARLLGGNSNQEQGRSAWAYVARDREGIARAAAIVTPKKGGSLKVMPIASRDQEAFRALVVDLPILLHGRGRKIYMHDEPSAEEIAILQDAGWECEALLPNAYKLHSTAQQWGWRNSSGVPMRQLRIHERYLSQIAEGAKTLEIRVNYPHLKTIDAGDDLRLISSANKVLCRVSAVRRYESFAEMLSCEHVEKALPGLKPEDALKQLHEIYPPEKERLGVLVIEMTNCRSLGIDSPVGDGRPRGPK